MWAIFSWYGQKKRVENIIVNVMTEWFLLISSLHTPPIVQVRLSSYDALDLYCSVWNWSLSWFNGPPKWQWLSHSYLIFILHFKWSSYNQFWSFLSHNIHGGESALGLSCQEEHCDKYFKFFSAVDILDGTYKVQQISEEMVHYFKCACLSNTIMRHLNCYQYH